MNKQSILYFIDFLSSIADKKNDTEKTKQEHRFLIYLGLAMSIGGIVWGTITLSNGLFTQSLFPYAYPLITLFNYTYLYYRKNFKTAQTIQVFISLSIPMIFQFALGGFVASGAVITWSILTILVNFTFQDRGTALKWFYAYSILIIISGMLDSTARQYAAHLDVDISVLFFTLNISMVSLVIFLLFFYFIQGKEKLQIKLEQLNSTLEEKVSSQVNEITKSVVLFETIFNTVQDGIAILDLDSNFLLVNHKYTEITHIPENKLLLTSSLALTSNDKKEELKDVFQKVLNDGHYEGFEKQYIVDDKYIDVQIDFILMPDKKNILAVTKDVTHIKQYKQERIKQEQQLLQHSRMAQMGEMISMIAHQWRQPLGAIASTTLNLKLKFVLGTFDLTTEEGAEEASAYIQESLEEIETFVQDLTLTIDDFRNFYKPNKQSVKATMESIISKSLNIIEASIANDNIKLTKEYNSNLEVEIHDSEMMQVILNILKNSQDNFKEKKIKDPYIKITTQGNIVSICDNGGGIPTDVIGHIFDPYFSTKTEKDGTGLGLHMSKIIIEEHHNGKLEVINTDDGVCFQIELNGI